MDNRCFASTWIFIRLQISDIGNVVVCIPPQMKIFHSAQTYIMKTLSSNLFVINELRQKKLDFIPLLGNEGEGASGLQGLVVPHAFPTPIPAEPASLKPAARRAGFPAPVILLCPSIPKSPKCTQEFSLFPYPLDLSLLGPETGYVNQRLSERPTEGEC